MIGHQAFNHVFGRWAGARVKYCPAYGNVGDRLIDLGTARLLKKFGIQPVKNGDYDVAFWASGGNMGNLYPASCGLRAKAAREAEALGKPFVILPQSWNSSDLTKHEAAYAREKYSLEFCPEAILAPDPALAYEPDFEIPGENFSVRDTGYYFREDKERTGMSRYQENIGDPALLAKSPREYISLAAQSRHIHTNRLHFAVSGLIAGRRVTLYPNSYHKNLGVWEMWLKDLGCEFNHLEAREDLRI